MIDENSALLKKVKNSFEEILKFSKFFEFEGYTYCKLQILSYKRNNIWIIEYMRHDFILEPDDQVGPYVSKEGNALYVQFSKPIITFLEMINFDKNGVHLSIDDYQIYFDDKFKSITHGKIINMLKNQYPYIFRESKVKLKFYFIHELYSSYSLNQFKYQGENFPDTNTGLISTGEDIFNDLMGMDYGLFSDCLIIVDFPIYSFSLSHEILKEEDKITIVFEKKIPNKLQDSIELNYQLNNEKKRNLNDKIIVSKNFSGRITISIKWYGDEAFLPKGTLLYKENIILEEEKKEKFLNKIDEEPELIMINDYKLDLFRKNYETINDLIFVLMPFNEELTPMYNDYIKIPIESEGYKVVRADDFFRPIPIMDDIWRSICEAEIIIADLTDRNPNVFYEVGLAHVLGKYTILITQDLNDIPFDLKSIRTIQYEYNSQGFNKLSDDLLKFVKAKK